MTQSYFGYEVAAPSGTYKGHRTLGELRASALADHPELEGLDPRKAMRKLERNTLELSLPNGTRIIRLHDTDVVTFHPNGTITLNTGGWQTVTSKARLNTYLPQSWGIYSDRGWKVRTPGLPEPVPYFDGMTFNPDGSLTKDSARRVWSKAPRVEADKKLIAKGIKSFTSKGIPHNPAGDPWVVSDERGLFEAGVVRDWLREDYITQRLLLQALTWGNRGNPAFCLRLSPSANASTLRRFLKACLGVGA